MRIGPAITMALETGMLSKNMDSYILELPNGASVSFINRQGDAADIAVDRLELEIRAFGTDMPGAIAFAKAAP